MNQGSDSGGVVQSTAKKPLYSGQNAVDAIQMSIGRLTLLSDKNREAICAEVCSVRGAVVQLRKLSIQTDKKVENLRILLFLNLFVALVSLLGVTLAFTTW